MIKNEPMVSVSGDTDQSRDSNGPISDLNEGSLSASTGSTLAEMFEEIKKTRYLRRPGNDDDIDDVLMTSHGYQTPLIIVGHTKYVMAEENNVETS